VSGAAAVTILRLGHVEFRVSDLGRARAFYVDLLGFVETAHDPERIYLRGLEEREHHSLTLRRAGAPGVSHFAFRVAAEEDLDRLHGRCAQAGLPVRWIEPGCPTRTPGSPRNSSSASCAIVRVWIGRSPAPFAIRSSV